MKSDALAVFVVFLLVVAVPRPAAAQVNMQLSGTIESIDGSTLTLLSKAPPSRMTLNPVPRPTLVVDLEGVPASQWVFLRVGDRITVVGIPSEDGQRFAAIRVIGGSG